MDGQAKLTRKEEVLQVLRTGGYIVKRDSRDGWHELRDAAGNEIGAWYNAIVGALKACTPRQEGGREVWRIAS